MSAKVFEIDDTGDAAFRKLMKEIGLVADLDVKVGFIQDNHGNRLGTEDSITNAQVAYYQEFGVPDKIPARPFLIPAVKQTQPQVADTLRQGLRVALGVAGDPNGIHRAMMQCGAIIRDRAKKNIVDQVGFKPLSPRTLRERRKAGFAGKKALIRTGQLLGAIQFQLNDENGKS